MDCDWCNRCVCDRSTFCHFVLWLTLRLPCLSVNQQPAMSLCHHKFLIRLVPSRAHQPQPCAERLSNIFHDISEMFRKGQQSLYNSMKLIEPVSIIESEWLVDVLSYRSALWLFTPLTSFFQYPPNMQTCVRAKDIHIFLKPLVRWLFITTSLSSTWIGTVQSNTLPQTFYSNVSSHR